jgi:hypothetical protein
MKKLASLLSGIVLLSFSFIACDQREFDLPPIPKPVYNDTATITIADFKNKYNAQSLKQITDSDVISGIVVANDVSGNFYKEITIRDSTAAIKIAINAYDLYTKYRLGQRVYIECKDSLWVGKYNGYMQIGQDYNGAIGQMQPVIADARIHLDGWPDPNDPLLTPESMTLDVACTTANLAKLITLKNVFFSEANDSVKCAPQTADGAVQTLSRTLKYSLNGTKSVVVRLSSAANFALKKLPKGNGDITGILSVYGSTYQFTPRDSMDFAFQGFGQGYTPHGLGTASDPYIPSWVLGHQDGSLSGWVSGYIVGSLVPGINETNPVNGNEDIKRSSPFMENTVVIAADSLETDWKKCIVVNLPDTSIRKSVNLSDNPRNLHKKLTVLGNFKNQLGSAGVVVLYGTGGEFIFGNIVAGESLPFAETFLTTSGLNKFTSYNAGGSQIWGATTYGATMSGYVNFVNYANEDWLFSPSIFLGGVSSANIVFSHANYFKAGGNLPSVDFTLWITTDYVSGVPSSGTWEKLIIPTYTTATASWTFYSSGTINIPSKYLGKNIRLGFKYLSTATAASTWEIKNLEVKGVSIF